MAEEIILYNAFMSSCSYRARIALNIKGIDYKYVHDFSDEDLAKGNSRLQIPTLAIDGTILAETVAIIEYLEETRPEPPLLPKDPKDRAFVRKLVQRMNAGTQPLQNMIVLGDIESLGGPEAKLKWAQKWIGKGLAAFEADIKDTAGKFCFGDKVSMADVYLVPQAANAGRFKIDLAEYPTINRVVTHLSTLPEFVKAAPMNQVDAEPL
eukprot:TRINITY_DN38631_c0_g1_i1.p1 TRINITY_DN38631_c0_g1~~TRINITY_DN38631_c0_g1_i1.p1  ORF type:complete len:242 (-),score=38.09 TRINITY_DN38631_c0_g1_i1:528-1154(-)